MIVSKTPEGCITKICDFGSSHSNCNACYKGSKNKAGTFQWSSPEVLEEEPATAKSDVWTFGCVALEASRTLVSSIPLRIHRALTTGAVREEPIP